MTLLLIGTFILCIKNILFSTGLTCFLSSVYIVCGQRSFINVDYCVHHVLPSGEQNGTIVLRNLLYRWQHLSVCLLSSVVPVVKSFYL